MTFGNSRTAPTTLSRRDNLKIAQRFNAGFTSTPRFVPKGRLSRRYNTCYWVIAAVSFLWILSFELGASAAAPAPIPPASALTATQSAFFENKIRPLLTKNCYKCHSSESLKLKGELLL